MRPASPSRSTAVALALIAIATTPAFATFPIDPNVPNLLSGSVRPYAGCPDGAGGTYVASQGVGGGGPLQLYHVVRSGDPAPGWPAGGIAVAVGPGDRDHAQLMPDGAGGVYVTWDDTRLGPGLEDIYLQRITSGGAIAPGWPANGLRVSTDATKPEYFPQIAPDGAGGAYLAWDYAYSGTDYDVYAARVSGSGAIQFSGGIEISLGMEVTPRIALDSSIGQLAIFHQYKPTGGGATYDIHLTYVSSTGSIGLRRNVCVAAGDQYLYVAVATPSGKAYAVWRDGRTGNFTVYATCYLAGNSFFGVWPVGDGLPVADAGTYQSSVVATSDASSALWVAITDNRFAGSDIVVQRYTTAGTPALGWPSSGLVACSASGDQGAVDVGVDGAQDAVILWTDRRSGPPTENDMFATRLRPDGSVAPGFAYNGQPLALEPGAQQSPGFVVPDPEGGAYVGWQDGTTALQHLDRFGALGDVAPHLTAVRDVRGDQGGSVRLQWNASPYDAEPISSISAYWVWRATPAALAAKAVARGARWLGADAARDPAADAWPGALFMADPFGATAYAWEYLASLPASLLPAYSYVAATTADSTGGGNPYTAFMVQARSVATGAFWSSPPDSGYSVDDLAPAAPSPFSGLYSAGNALLAWGAPPDPDVSGYRLHRGPSPAFTPGPSTLVASPSATSYADAAGSPYWYKVAAVDVHGNVGPYATTLPVGALAAPGESIPTELALAIAGANPWRGGPITLRYALPADAHVRLSVFDVNGRRVRTIVNADEPAGLHDAAWDGRDDASRPIADGLYFARLEAGARHIDRRLTRIH